MTKALKQIRLLAIGSVTYVLALIALPARVFAASAAACTSDTSGFLGLPTWYKYLNPKFVNGECVLMPDANGVSNFNFFTDLPKVLLAVFEIILRIGGLVAVGFVIYGGIQYIISQGEPDKAKGARTTILNAIIGLVITLSAVAIVNVIGKNI